jgi:hypothetical protein
MTRVFPVSQGSSSMAARMIVDDGDRLVEQMKETGAALKHPK